MAISAAEYQRRLSKVLDLPTLQELAYIVMVNHERDLKLLKEQDYLIGDIYGDGTLVPYRSMTYAMLKEKMNPTAGGAVDLIYTGNFVDSMLLNEQVNGVYSFDNSDRKKSILATHYGTAIFGLNQDVFNKFQSEVALAEFIQEIMNYADIG